MQTLSPVASKESWNGIAYQILFQPLTGNILALLVPVVLMPSIAYIKPECFNFMELKEPKCVDDTAFANIPTGRDDSSMTAGERQGKEWQSHNATKKQLLGAGNMTLVFSSIRNNRNDSSLTDADVCKRVRFQEEHLQRMESSGIYSRLLRGHHFACSTLG